MEKHVTHITRIGDTIREARPEAPYVGPVLEIERFDQWSDGRAGIARSAQMMCYCIIGVAA